ncbi:unnamed protein product, partial [marine sediment metagenome]
LQLLKGIRTIDLPNLASGIDAIDTVVDAIRSTDVVNLASGIAAVDTIVANIHDTDLPAVNTLVTTVDSVVDNIRNIDVPNIQANIDVNESLLDDIQFSHYLYAVASDDTLLSDDGEESTDSMVYVKMKELRVVVPGTYRITFSINEPTGLSTVNCTVYKNDGAHGTPQSDSSGSYVEKTEDLVFEAGDLIQAYLNTSNSIRPAYIKEFRVKGIINIHTV